MGFHNFIKVLWDSGLTIENKSDLGRTQKTFAIYKIYNEALLHLGLQNLELRRTRLSLDFAKRILADGHFGDLLKKRKLGPMKLRKRNYYKVTHADTEGLKNSPIITMQKLLNEDKKLHH